MTVTFLLIREGGRAPGRSYRGRDGKRDQEVNFRGGRGNDVFTITMTKKKIKKASPSLFDGKKEAPKLCGLVGEGVSRNEKERSLIFFRKKIS